MLRRLLVPRVRMNHTAPDVTPEVSALCQGSQECRKAGAVLLRAKYGEVSAEAK